MSATWYHGGPRIAGPEILPPAATGASRKHYEGLTDDPDVLDASWVYVTNDRTAALLFASANNDPWIYEVAPIGDLADDPDFVGDGDGITSKRCRAARIVRRLKPSNAELYEARMVLLGFAS